MGAYKKVEIDYEDKIAKDYNAWYHQTPIQKYHARDFVKYIKKEMRKNDQVLDLGCGPASLWDELIKIKHIQLIGADVSPKMIQEARKFHPQGRFVVADSEKLLFKDEEFDVVICSSVLHHLPSPNKSLKEITRVLKPYGTLIGREPQTDPFLKGVSPWLTGAIMGLVHLMRRREHHSPPKEPPIHKHHKCYDIKEFSDFVEKNNLVIQDIKSKFPFSSNFADMRSRLGSRMILKVDKTLKNHKGNQFFYKAIKYGYGRKEIIFNVYQYLRILEKESNKSSIKLAKILVWLALGLDLALPKK